METYLNICIFFVFVLLLLSDHIEGEWEWERFVFYKNRNFTRDFTIGAFLSFCILFMWVYCLTLTPTPFTSEFNAYEYITSDDIDFFFLSRASENPDNDLSKGDTFILQCIIISLVVVLGAYVWWMSFAKRQQHSRKVSAILDSQSSKHLHFQMTPQESINEAFGDVANALRSTIDKLRKSQ